MKNQNKVSIKKYLDYSVYYKISGSDKKLMSDRYIEISQFKQYRLRL